MPLITDSKIVRIVNDDHPGEWYELKTRLTWKELEQCTGTEALKMRQRSLFNQSRQRTNGRADEMMEISIDSVVMKTAKIETILNNWSHPVPITPDNIEKVDAPTMSNLLAICDEIIDANKGGEFREDFLSGNLSTSSGALSVVEMQPAPSSLIGSSDS